MAIFESWCRDCQSWYRGHNHACRHPIYNEDGIVHWSARLQSKSKETQQPLFCVALDDRELPNNNKMGTWAVYGVLPEEGVKKILAFANEMIARYAKPSD